MICIEPSAIAVPSSGAAINGDGTVTSANMSPIHAMTLAALFHARPSNDVAPAPMGCLASQLSCDQSYVTRLADDLVKRGLVTRAPGDDRRVQVLTLTPAGIALKNQLAQAVSVDKAVSSALTPVEQEQLSALLTRILNMP
ncbi:MarR family transcriptional regulator [bacterium]|nr:MarR family transcriptional regulator [bacterium]